MKISTLLILLMCVAGCSVQEIKTEDLPNLILYSIDTLRSDRLGVYGNQIPISPDLDRLSRQGIVFQSVVSQSPLTAPSHMSLFTSLYPEVHRVENFSNKDPVRLSSDLTTLTESLKNAGYKTVAFTDGGNISGSLGFDRGFESYGNKGPIPFVEWVKTKPQEPWFVFLHNYWVHDPYLVYSPYHKMFDPDYQGGIIGDKDRFNEKYSDLDYAKKRTTYWSQVDYLDKSDREHLVRIYEGGIRGTDLSFPVMCKLLDDLGYKDKTILIVTSDHGEEFFEHSRILHERLYSETLSVPVVFIDFSKKIKPRIIDQPIQLIDLTPTILDYIGLPPIKMAQGISMLPLMNGNSSKESVMHALAPAPYLSQMTQKGKWKYIFNPIQRPVGGDLWELNLPRPAVPTEELYLLSEDPGEKIDKKDAYPDKLKEMRDLNTRHHAQMNTLGAKFFQEKTELGEGSREQLKALGYLE